MNFNLYDKDICKYDLKLKKLYDDIFKDLTMEEYQDIISSILNTSLLILPERHKNILPIKEMVFKLREITWNYLETTQKAREEVEIPQDGISVSDFANVVSTILQKRNAEIFYKTKESKIVEIGVITDDKIKEDKSDIDLYTGFIDVTPNRLINIIENNMLTGINKIDKEKNLRFYKRTLTNATTQILLCNDCWKNKLRKISRVLTAPIPILYEGKLTFPNIGHDERFNTWLKSDSPKIDINLSTEEAKKTLEFIYREFCFKNEQSKINAISHLITQFCQGLFLSFNTRTPIMLYEGNRERSGKDYCANIPCLVFEGITKEDNPISTVGKNNNSVEELRKKITTMLKNGRRRFHSSNNTGHISNEVLESLATNNIWTDRILGGNTEINIPNELFISMSANTGFTSTPDFINRCRFIRLELCVEDANERIFETPLLHEWIKNNRGLILSSLYALVREWYNAGMPKGITPFASFPNWAQIVGGIMTFNNLGDPCKKDINTFISADKDTTDMKNLYEFMYEKKPETWMKKSEIFSFISSEQPEMFNFIDFNKNSEGKFNKRDTMLFAFKLAKFLNREFSFNKNDKKFTIKLIVDDEQKRAEYQRFMFTNINKNTEQNFCNNIPEWETEFN